MASDEKLTQFLNFLFTKNQNETNEVSRHHNRFHHDEIGSDAAKLHLFNQAIFPIDLRF